MRILVILGSPRDLVCTLLLKKKTKKKKKPQKTKQTKQKKKKKNKTWHNLNKLLEACFSILASSDMNMFELFKYGPQDIVKLTKDGLQVIFKLTKLRSALIEHFSIYKNPKLY